MDRQNAIKVARQILDSLGLDEWTVQISGRSKITWGRCECEKKTIRLSAHFVDHSPADMVLDTVLHEAAHALVPTDYRHGSRWACQYGLLLDRYGMSRQNIKTYYWMMGRDKDASKVSLVPEVPQRFRFNTVKL